MSASPMHVLLDTNAVLDVIMNRDPFVEDALVIMSMGEAGALKLSLSTDAISTVFYIIERNRDAATARQAILNLTTRVNLAALDGAAVLRGLSYDFVDIEDALVASVAESVGADVIVTRNAKDFVNSPVTAMSPAEFIAFWHARQHGGSSKDE